jgi:hypothetical protein
MPFLDSPAGNNSISLGATRGQLPGLLTQFKPISKPIRAFAVEYL